jgi:HAD superfamily hydrolase (TIGR01457 family)
LTAATDHQPKATGLKRLRSARGYVFDMDGVLYRGSSPLPGAAELFAALELRSIQYRLATNNSTSTPAQYVAKLARMGLEVPEEWIVTSGVATRDYLISKFPAGSPVLVIGEPALSEQLFIDHQFVKSNGSTWPPAAVVAGLDRQFNYAKLSEASTAIRSGAAFVATNADVTLPTEHGLEPGGGSIVAAIAAASGITPTIVGKPETLLFQMACVDMALQPEQVVSVGDRLDTDIVAGSRAGTLTVLVLTGVSTRAEIARAAMQPDLVFSDLPALLQSLSD